MELTVGSRTLKLSNLEKVFWPEKGFTKYDLVKFYIEISPYLLPYLRERPCNFQRFPDGIRGKRFYQKSLPAYAPPWIETISIPSGERVIDYIMVNNLETLVYVVNLACLEIHPWHSRRGTIAYPDYGIVDLDPQEGVDFKAVIEAARVVKWVLDRLGLSGYPKTSGATGLQIYIPLEPRYTYEQVRDMVEFICRLVHREIPEITTMERKVARRGATVYLDYLQNLWGKTINAPYTVRPVEYAGVSTPLGWDEVESGHIRPENFTISNIFDRIKAKGDVFAPVLKEKQSVDHVLKLLYQ